MTPKQIELVQSSFIKVLPHTELVAETFYRRLFQLDPSLRSMFRGDMKEQGRKLMDVLKIVVSSLKNVHTILPAVVQLGRRHVDYGVKREHYATVGQALIDTLQAGLGAAFTDEVSEAWLAAYSLLSHVMNSAGEAREREIVFQAVKTA